MARRRRNKRKDQRLHAAGRAVQRFGIKWNRHKLRDFKEKLHNGELELLERQSNRVGVYRYEVDGETVSAVYDRHRGEVVTFLHLEWMGEKTEEGRQQEYLDWYNQCD